MDFSNLEYARLTREQIAQLREAEEALGATIVAFKRPVKMAELSSEQVAKLQALEKEIGVLLLAYDPET